LQSTQICKALWNVKQEWTDFIKIKRTPQISRRRKFHTKDPQISGASVQNLLARLGWLSGFVHPCCKATKLWLRESVCAFVFYGI